MFTIRPENRGYVLFAGNLKLKWYEKASLAAEAVYKRETGWYEWDGLRTLPEKTPADLEGWMRAAR